LVVAAASNPVYNWKLLASSSHRLIILYSDLFII